MVGVNRIHDGRGLICELSQSDQLSLDALIVLAVLQSMGQSISVLAPGAAPIASSMYSAGFVPIGHFGAPLREK
jgi:hypothetical protein